MNTHITWFEGVFLLVEKKFPIGHGPWKIAYLIAVIALLPSVLNMGAGTGAALCSYAAEGFYGSAPWCRCFSFFSSITCRKPSADCDVSPKKTITANSLHAFPCPFTIGGYEPQAHHSCRGTGGR